MKIVIQCAGRKQDNAGSLRLSSGTPVTFVAQPDKAPSDGKHYARPDDVSDDERTWREQLLDYNKSGENSYGLLPAYRLYTNPAYENLVIKFGIKNVYILSAGWGLIPANFLTPAYDITFSSTKNKCVKRKKKDEYKDFNMLPDSGEDIIFLGGKDYLPLFCHLTSKHKGKKKVFYNLKNKPVLPPDFDLIKYETTARTNRHYSCSADLIDEKLLVI